MANFFIYRVKRIFSPPNLTLSRPDSFTRFVPEFALNADSPWRPVFPGDQPQSLDEAKNRLAEVVEAEDTFRLAVVSGRLGTLEDYTSFP